MAMISDSTERGETEGVREEVATDRTAMSPISARAETEGAPKASAFRNHPFSEFVERPSTVDRNEDDVRCHLLRSQFLRSRTGGQK